MVRGRSVATAVTAAAVVGAAAARARPRNWGARPGDVHGRYPGDELLPGPVSSTTDAITVEAPAEIVWSCWCRWPDQGKQDLPDRRGIVCGEAGAHYAGVQHGCGHPAAFQPAGQ